MPRIIFVYTQSSETEKEKQKAQLLYRFAHPPVTRGPISQRENAILKIHERLKNGTKRKLSILSKAWETIGMVMTSWNFFVAHATLPWLYFCI